MRAFSPFAELGFRRGRGSDFCDSETWSSDAGRGKSSVTSKTAPNDDFFSEVPVAEIPRFGSGQVAEILGVELWQLNRFLSRYELSSSGQLGEGRGSRRVYTAEDIYRIKTAMFLIRDGFALKLVAQIMQRLEDEDFYGVLSEEGNFRSIGISLWRSEKGRPEVRFYRADKPPEVTPESKAYYLLNLSTVTRDIDRRIAELKIA